MLLAAGIAVGLTAWSLAANLRLGDTGYLARNAVATLALLAVARIAGLSPGALGLASGRLPAGLLWGGVGAGVVAIAFAVVVALAPRVAAFRAALADQRAALASGSLRYHTWLRIPIGTALFEEVAFRGLLLGVLLAVASRPGAVVWSSLVFGLWHIAPTAVLLRLNGRDPRSARGVRTIAAAVLATGIAGMLLAALRLASGSLLAPVLVHWAANALGLVVAARTSAD